MLTHQGQLHQRTHRAVAAQQRVGQLEHRIPAGGQAAVELPPEHRQPPELIARTVVMHTDHQTALDF
jgi:hypothetical protein